MTIKTLDPDEAKRRARDNVAQWKKRKLMEQKGGPPPGKIRGQHPLDAEARKGLDSMINEAAEAGDHDAVKDLLDKGADVNAKDDEGDSVLVNACRSGSLRIVELLLDRGASVEPSEGYSPLNIACFHGHTLIARTLVDKGADVNGIGPDGYTPLALAMEDTVCLETVHLLISAGADVNARINGRSILRMAMARTEVPALPEILKKAGARG